MFRTARHPSLLHRLSAVLGVVLVMLLAALAASPELHAWVHGDGDAAEHASTGNEPVGDTDHVCAVTLFASGVEALLVFCLLVFVRLSVRSIVLRPRDWLFAASPRYWHVPAHAPPLV